MENTIELCSISELLGRNFFVPSYQRGYRWTKNQVEDLLNDIYSFAIREKQSKKEFYCLQPIVVKACSGKTILTNNLESNFENNKWYEVIDGQQRLTTIHILISYLVKELYPGQTLYDKHKKNPFLIEYETRKGCNAFLNNISKSNDCIDYYFISEAFETIKDWFNSAFITDPQQVKESIRNTLIYGLKNQNHEGIVQVIWYEINDTSNPIDTFSRINKGKIPLTNAELIRSLFLQKRNFGDNETAKLRQIEIANEWDRIEYSLQDDNFWWFLNRQKNDMPSRIEFLFNLICDIARKENSEIEKQIGTDKYSTFRFFNHKFSKEVSLDVVEEEWNKVKDYFLAFEEWFNEPVWYHYIGFLIYCGITIVDIYNMYRGQAKSIFTNNIKKKIKNEILRNINCMKIKNENGIHYKIDLPYENINRGKIKELLLLLNLQFIVQQYEITMETSGGEVFIKFPFKLFKKQKWDVEHIDSYTTNPIKDKANQNLWLQTAEFDLQEKLSMEIKDKIKLFISLGNNEKLFIDLKSKIIEIAGEKPNDEIAKNNIGNLTLLDEETNRKYGNALFPSKRRIIIERDMEGKFIPICTKNVFLKYFDIKGRTRTQWGEEDIVSYQNFIGKVLDQFLTFKSN